MLILILLFIDRGEEISLSLKKSRNGRDGHCVELEDTHTHREEISIQQPTGAANHLTGRPVETRWALSL